MFPPAESAAVSVHGEAQVRGKLFGAIMNVYSHICFSLVGACHAFFPYCMAGARFRLPTGTTEAPGVMCGVCFRCRPCCANICVCKLNPHILLAMLHLDAAGAAWFLSLCDNSKTYVFGCLKLAECGVLPDHVTCADVTAFPYIAFFFRGLRNCVVYHNNSSDCDENNLIRLLTDAKNVEVNEAHSWCVTPAFDMTLCV